MKERPILFSAPMVRAILDGSKTQTRRVGKSQCSAWSGLAVEYRRHAKHGLQAVASYESYPGKGTARTGICACPYGVPGDQLWGRESYYQIGHWESVTGKKTKGGRQKWAFSPDSDSITFDAPEHYRKGRHAKDPQTSAWHKRLGRFMPRKASRITLEVTGIRVERLNDISEADAKAEGTNWKNYIYAAEAYKDLWETINGPGSWDANPWVWVVDFRKVEA